MAQRTTPEELDELRAEVERLNKALANETELRTAAEEDARKAASAQGLAMLGSNVEEIPAGKLAKVKRCTNPWARDAKEHEFETVEVPLYFYKVDLPPSGGMDVSLNGIKFFHGETYEVDLYVLRTLKDIVGRCWGHEQSIRGSNENAYRKQSGRILRGNERSTRH